MGPGFRKADEQAARSLGIKQQILEIRINTAPIHRVAEIFPVGGYPSRAQGITLEEAEEQEQWNDEVRSQISIELFGWNPLDNSSYDMVFNTSHMPAATCADLIAGAARAKAERPQPTESTQQ